METTMFQRGFVAGCRDIDIDGRFRNSTCLERAGDIRTMFFANHGNTVESLRQQRLLPVVMKDKLEYLRNIELLEEYKVSLTLAGLAPDGSRYMLRTELVRGDGKAAVKVTSTCCWVDLNTRKMTAPPKSFIDLLQRLPMTSDYQILNTSNK